VSPSQSTFSYGAPSPAVGSDIEVEYPAARPSVFRSRLIDIWADADPVPLPRPAAASVDRARPVAARVDVGRMSLPYASVDVRRPGSAVCPRLLEPATSVFAGASTAAMAQPGSLGVATPRTRMRSDTPMPSSDVGQQGLARPMRIDVPRPLDLTLPIASDDVAPLSVARPSDVAYTLPPGNVDVAGPACGPAPLTVIDVACTPGPSSVNAPRPAGVNVHRPMPPMGVRQPKSSVPVDVVASLPGPAPPTRDVVGQPGLGRPTSVDVTRYPGLPFASVDVVRQPHSSFMGADVVRPTPTRADVPPVVHGC